MHSFYQLFNWIEIDPHGLGGGNARNKYPKKQYLIKRQLLATGLAKQMWLSEPWLTRFLPVIQMKYAIAYV